MTLDAGKSSCLQKILETLLMPLGGIYVYIMRLKTRVYYRCDVSGRCDGDSGRAIRFVMLVHNIQRRSFFGFHPHTLFTVEMSLILPESHTSATVSMSYGKRVHNSPVSHAFTRPSNRRRPQRLRARCLLSLSYSDSKLYAPPRQAMYRRVVNYSGQDLINNVTYNYRRVLSNFPLITVEYVFSKTD